MWQREAEPLPLPPHLRPHRAVFCPWTARFCWGLCRTWPGLHFPKLLDLESGILFWCSPHPKPEVAEHLQALEWLDGWSGKALLLNNVLASSPGRQQAATAKTARGKDGDPRHGWKAARKGVGLLGSLWDVQTYSMMARSRVLEQTHLHYHTGSHINSLSYL